MGRLSDALHHQVLVEPFRFCFHVEVDVPTMVRSLAGLCGEGDGLLEGRMLQQKRTTFH